MTRTRRSSGTTTTASPSAREFLAGKERRLNFLHNDNGATFAQDFFYVSNEWDWQGIDGGAEKADVVISFSNNIDWDEAIECGAESLVLVDYQAAPLLMHRLFFRPLLLMAESAPEFLSLLNGRELPPKTGLEEAFRTLRQRPSQMRPMPGQSDLDAMKRFHESILRCARGDEDAQELLGQYYLTTRAVWASRLKLQPEPCAGYLLPINETRMFFYSVTEGVNDNTRKGRELSMEWLFSMRNRYCTLDNQRNFRSAEVTGLKDSCLSTAENFKKLRELFKDNVFFAKGDIGDAGLWRAIAKKFRGPFGRTRFLVNLSNVPQFVESSFPTVVDLMGFIATQMKTEHIRFKWAHGTNDRHDYKTLGYDQLTDKSIDNVLDLDLKL